MIIVSYTGTWVTKEGWGWVGDGGPIDVGVSSLFWAWGGGGEGRHRADSFGEGGGRALGYILFLQQASEPRVS